MMANRLCRPSGWPKDEWIIDEKMTNPDGHDPAEIFIYDTYYAQKVVMSKDKKEMEKAFYNADNYAMFARVSAHFTFFFRCFKRANSDYRKRTSGGVAPNRTSRTPPPLSQTPVYRNRRRPAHRRPSGCKRRRGEENKGSDAGCLLTWEVARNCEGMQE
jgi:hypothetical protein